jgi:hypothetical protein
MSRHPSEDMSRLVSELGLDEIEFEEPEPQAWELARDPAEEEPDGFTGLAGELEARRRTTRS